MIIPQDESWFAKYRWFLGLFLLLMISMATVTVAIGVFDNNASAMDEIIIVKIKEGDFEKIVTSYGVLKPKQQRTLISRSAGTLVEIRKRPGEKVSADSVVFVLSNPNSVSAVRKAKLELQKAKADFSVLAAELLDQKRTMANNLLMLQAEISTKQAELEAQEILAERSIISELELRQARLKLHQLELQLELAKKKEMSTEEAIKAKRMSGLLAVEQAQYLLETEQEKQQALNVTAGIDGVLQSQESNLALGQWLNSGESLGIVSSIDNLYAELNVNATDAYNVQLGMSVRLSVRGRQVNGEVVRVAPNAINNQVQVDVNIDDELPSIARSNLDIRGDIIITRQAEARLLPRPKIYRPDQPLKLYVHKAEGIYQLQSIEVLEASSNELLIGNSLAVASQVILNDPTQWQAQPIIAVEP